MIKLQIKLITVQRKWFIMEWDNAKVPPTPLLEGRRGALYPCSQSIVGNLSTDPLSQHQLRAQPKMFGWWSCSRWCRQSQCPLEIWARLLAPPLCLATRRTSILGGKRWLRARAPNRRVHVLVKADVRPARVPKLDEMVLLKHLHCKKAWTNSLGHIPESSVAFGLSGVELSLNLPIASQKRRSRAECLAWSKLTFSPLTPVDHGWWGLAAGG